MGWPNRRPRAYSRNSSRARITLRLAGRPGPVGFGIGPKICWSSFERCCRRSNLIALRSPAPEPATMDRVPRTPRGGGERPMVVAGGPGWDQAARDELAFIRRNANGLPVGVSVSSPGPLRQCTSQLCWSCWNRNRFLALAAICVIKTADLLIALVGARMGEMTTSAYSLHRHSGRPVRPWCTCLSRR